MNTKTTKDTILSVSHGNANETDSKASGETKDTKLIFESEDAEQHEVKNTPFCIGRRKKEWVVLLGNQILVSGLTRAEAVKEAKKVDWNKIAQFTWELIRKTNELNQITKA